MNKRQKELLQLQLDNEKAVLKKLQGIYKKALDDVNNHIAVLIGRTDSENLQSIVYQLNYQKALKTQINGILDNLASNQYTTISDYLANCYENGFIGTMYDLHGQGIPLLFPLNQDLVVRAVQNEAPLVDAFYDYLGEDVNLLKKRVANNISRGMAQGSSYAEITRNIERGMIGDYSKVNGGAMYDAYRIARTEGHRITNAATHDAQIKAKDAGADVVKQWDAAMDRRTRKSHARVDGEIREIDDTFSNGLMYPGDSAGSAAEVINCRCACLQRAKWALDDDELQMLEARAEFFGLDKTDSFEDFKQKYLTAANKVAAQKADISATTQKLSASMNKADYEEFRKLVEDNPDIEKLYSKADQISNISASASNGYYQPSSNSLVYSYPQQRYIDNGMSKYETLAHEYGHFFDVMVKYSTTSYKEADALNAVCKYSKIKKAASTSDEFLSAMRADKKYIKSILTAEVRADLKAHDASCGVQDAIDGLFGVRIGWGHGDKYYNRKYSHMKQLGDEKAAKGAYLALGMDASNQAKVRAIVRNYETASELWANMMSAETTGGEALEYIKKFFPETYKTFVEIIKGAL